MNSISCPTINLCVAVEYSNVITSSNPTGGAAAWTVTNVDGRNSLTAVSCPTTTFCVAVDGVGNAIVGTSQP